jgi:hypothetical protein
MGNSGLWLFEITLLRRKPRLRAEAHFGAQARSLRPWMNALRVPYEARKSAVGYASEGSACLREAASAKAGPTKHVEEPGALARGAPLNRVNLSFDSGPVNLKTSNLH